MKSLLIFALLLSAALLAGGCKAESTKGCPNCGGPIGVITKSIYGKHREVSIRTNCSNCQMPLRSAMAAGNLHLEDYGFKHIWKQNKFSLIFLAVLCVGAMMEWLIKKGGEKKHPEDTNLRMPIR